MRTRLSISLDQGNMSIFNSNAIIPKVIPQQSHHYSLLGFVLSTWQKKAHSHIAHGEKQLERDAHLLHSF
jgi:hypothetical protein